MAALGEFIEFVKLEEKGVSMTNADLMHGKVVSVGEQVKIPIKMGDKIVVSTVKKLQDMVGGEMHYWVIESQVIHKI